MGQNTATHKGGGIITENGDKKKTTPEKEEAEGETSAKDDKKKGNVREYDPLKDSACLMIGGYSSYIKKKKILAQGN
jgi:hypothetical protein